MRTRNLLPYPRFTRRELLNASAGTALGATVFALAGCDTSLDPEGVEEAERGKGKNPPEAPALTPLVDRGELPSVAERLPASPAMVEPVELTGQYGGRWRTVTTGPADYLWWWRTVGYDPLVRMDDHSATLSPNIAERFEVNADGTVHTFFLRDGIKWSDGQPFTAEDIAFWYDDFIMNKDVSPGALSWMVTGGQPGLVESVDELTVRFTFPGGPNGFLPYWLASFAGFGVVTMPKHYLRQFHADYNDDIDSVVREAGFDSWAELFAFKSGQDQGYAQSELPVIRPWVMMSEVGVGQRLLFERNPFYWKTDPVGSQLPYLDEVSFDVVEDLEVILVNATNGEFDYLARHVNFPANKPVLAQGRGAGDYRLPDLSSAEMANVGVISLNLTHKDPVKREIFQNVDFRIGLSHAIDRAEIIKVVYQQQGEPWQAAPREGCRFFDEEMARQYTDYDVDLANEHLDKAGFTARDDDGFRLGPTAQRISFRFIASTAGGGLDALLIDAQELIKGYWAEVGVEVGTDPMERSLFFTRSQNNDFDARMYTGFGGGDLTAIIFPGYYLPVSMNDMYAVEWVQWYESDGEAGEQPPDEIVDQLTTYRKVLATPDDAERDDLFREVLRIAKEEFPVIGISSYPDVYQIVADDFRNVPERQPDAWPFPNPGLSHPEQFFRRAST